ncbi:MAG: acyl--CoA ligase [Oscillospiraceae bacterium]|nr:acyl--CoA ligase [Oscillospiraceae bacterium]
MNKSEKEQFEKVKQRLQSGELIRQPCWSFIRELNSYSEERLDSVAVRDGYRSYTYRQMFRFWERYAEAFSGANISAGNHSRVALIAPPQTETIFAFYGLNMTGASVSHIYHLDLYDEKQLYSMIEKEKITDLVVSEIYAFPLLMKRLLRDREMLGLRNIVLLQSPMGGEFGIPALEIIRNTNKELFRELPGGLLMEDLLEEYEACPITYGEGNSDIILHTTGTVSGMHKPIPLTDQAMNAFVISALEAKETYEDFKKAPKHLVTFLTLYLNWVYAMVDMLHTPLGLGMEIVTLPWGGTNPRYSEAIEYYGINVMFTSKTILDTWLKTMPEMDLSKVKIVFMGGTYISPEFKQEFNNYLRSCGSSARIINGYGLSELGGACMLCPSSREDDAIGFLLPGFKAKILVEEENRYYDISDGPRTGVLLLSSPTMSSGKLDDTVFFELDEIDGEKYFNSHDLMRVNEDGSLTCIGRSNQFFVNNAGVRFDAGLIENAVTSQPGVAACGLAPEFHKILHDNVPVLYVEMRDQGAGALSVLRQALIQVFIKDGMLADTNLPSQCVFTETIPLNSNGKVDAKKLASGSVTGSRYSVNPVRIDGKVIDILLVPAPEGELATMGGGIPEELENDPYNILSEVFAAIPDLNKGRFSKLFKIPGLRDLVLKLTGFDMKNIPASMWNITPKMFSLAYRKYVMPFLKGADAMGGRKSQNRDLASLFEGMMPMIQGKPVMPPMPIMPIPVFPMPMMPMPMMPFMQNRNGRESTRSSTDGNNSGDDTKKFWAQFIDMQKSAMDSSREQWNQFFEYIMEMEDTFTESLPDDMPALPGFPFGLPAMSPKEFMKQLKEFQKMMNEYLVEQTDSCIDLILKGQKQFCDVVSEADNDAGGDAPDDESEQ